MENQKFYNVNKKYLADALSFLGFRYFKFIDKDNKQVYSFIDTNNFRTALSKLLQLKQEFDN